MVVREMSGDDSDEYKYQIDPETGEIEDSKPPSDPAVQQGQTRYLFFSLLEFGIVILFATEAARMGVDGLAENPLWAAFLFGIGIIALLGSMDSLSRYLHGKSLLGRLLGNNDS